MEIGENIRLCKCGCNEWITYKKFYKFYGVPSYLPHHHPTWKNGLTKENSEKLRESTEKTGKTLKKLYAEGKLIPYYKGKNLLKETKRKIGLANKGKKRTEETKQKIRISMIKNRKEHPEIIEEIRKKLQGRIFSEEHKKKISLSKIGNLSRTGQKNSIETRRKISKSNIGKHIGWSKGLTKETDERVKSMSIKLSNKGNPMYGKLGNLAPGWKGGLSFEPYGIEFNKKIKEQIRRRDNFICQKCKKAEQELKRKLSIHHIDYNKKNNCPLNLISLCSICHTKTNDNRKKWENFFQSLLRG